MPHPARGKAWVATGSIGTSVQLAAPVTVVEANRALAIGTWAFVLEPLAGGRTRLLVRERNAGWIRRLIPARLGLLRAAGGAIDYAIGEPLHFVMSRKMMLGLKHRAKQTGRQQAPGCRPT